MIRPSAALFYHPEAYSISGPKLMGRNAAGESFFRGFIKYSRSQSFWAQIDSPEHGENFATRVRSFGRGESVHLVQKNCLHELSKAGVLFLPGPGVGDHALNRTRYGDSAWSLCGITHTTSSHLAMDAITALMNSPVQPWDCLICTSTAVKDNVIRILQAQADYLVRRLGVTKLVLPQLPVIPLGIHTEDFLPDPQHRRAARDFLTIQEDEIVILYVGRLSFHAKAHPLVMYLALEKAASKTGKKLVLIECGWHANPPIAAAYTEAAELACPSVRVVHVDGRDSHLRSHAWAAADIFCSLSDNIQETFGIVPVEAMAAGLPVVVSDWDGYRDTVRHGIDGFRIPTYMPEGGLGDDLAHRYALDLDTYDMYCGYTSSLIAVDLAAVTEAFILLVTDSDLRARMGAEGQKRAQSIFDWKHIIPRYEELFDVLNQLRGTHVQDTPPLRHPWPGRMDPFDAFSAYPTHRLKVDTILSVTDSDPDALLRRALQFRSLAMVRFAELVLLKAEDIEKIIHFAIPQSTLGEIVMEFPQDRKSEVQRGLAWLIKVGTLKVV